MIIARRLVANVIDVLLFIVIIVAMFMLIVPSIQQFAGFYELAGVEELPPALAAAILVLIAGVYFGLQYPFLTNFQTIGKAFCGLRVISTNDERPLTFGIILQRELFAKVMSVYLMCIPVLFGREGKHDEACETKVVRI